jgi:hypothetical protein
MYESTQVWKTSSHCADGACVEVAVLDDGEVAMRATGKGDPPFLTFSRSAWKVFVGAAAAERLFR